MHVVHSVGFRSVLVLGIHTLCNTQLVWYGELIQIKDVATSLIIFKAHIYQSEDSCANYVVVVWVHVNYVDCWVENGYHIKSMQSGLFLSTHFLSHNNHIPLECRHLIKIRVWIRHVYFILCRALQSWKLHYHHWTPQLPSLGRVYTRVQDQRVSKIKWSCWLWNSVFGPKIW